MYVHVCTMFVTLHATTPFQSTPEKVDGGNVRHGYDEDHREEADISSRHSDREVRSAGVLQSASRLDAN